MGHLLTMWAAASESVTRFAECEWRAARFFRVSPGARDIAKRMLLCHALAALAIAACGGAPTVEPAAAPPVDPAQFSPPRFAANLRTLVAFGARAPQSAALANAREWAHANAPATRVDARIVLVASLEAPGATGDALVDASSGAALVLEAARALTARGEPVGVAFVVGALAPAPPIAGAEAVVYVRRACGMPQRRDLLSHRVLRERFFRAANVELVAFEQTRAPHEALLAAGAMRVVALDAPRAHGAECVASGFGEALLRFVTDATALLNRSHEK
jgi:hypothetical protein